MTSANVHYREIRPGPTMKENASILTQLRIDCGWNADAVPGWILDIERGYRLIWFIYNQPYRQPTNPMNVRLPIGMISLCLYDPKDPTLANIAAQDDSIRGRRAEVSSLFVYPDYRRRGVGKGAIDYVEEMAAQRGVDTVTMNTDAAGTNLEIYLKMGYQEYKPREKKWPLDEVQTLGFTEEHCWAAFLEKRLEHMWI